MPAWDNVNLPGAPAAPPYAAPLLDFANIGNLGNSYFQGQQQRNQLEQQNAFRNGVPTDPKELVQQWMRYGGTQTVPQALPLMQGQQLIDEYSRGAGPPDETQSQRQPIPEHGIPERPQARQGGGGGDQSGSIMDMVGAAGIPATEAGKIGTRIASALGVDPNTAISNPDMQANVQRRLGVEKLRAQQAQAQPQAAASDTSTLPPGVSETAAENLDKVSKWYANRANLAERIKPGTGVGDLKLSEQAAARAAKIREQLAAHGPSALEFETQKDVLKGKIAASEKKYTGINAQATQYEADLKPYVELSKSLLNDPRMYSGIGGQWSLDVNRVKAAFGDQTAATLQEALQKVTANTVLGQINQQRNEMAEAGGNSSRIFSQQVTQVEKAAPQLATTLGGNRFLVQVASKMGELAEQRARIAREYLAPGSGHRYLDEGFDEKLSKYMRDNPLFTKDELANPALVGAPQVPDAIAHDPAKIAAWTRAMKLGPNDVVRRHDGKYMLPPSGPAQPTPGAAIAGQQM